MSEPPRKRRPRRVADAAPADAAVRSPDETGPVALADALADPLADSLADPLADPAAEPTADGARADGSGLLPLDAPSGRDAARRITELELELRAARRTIDVLISRAERRAREPSQAELFEAAARMEQLIELRTRELADQQAELALLSTNLDQTVRQRTRALTESEQELKRKNAELERAAAARSEFIAIIAHELRTPMVSIVGYLDLLVEGRFGELAAEAERPVTSLRRNAHRLRRLVDEMLEFARLGAGRVKLQPEEVALGAVVAEALVELAPLAMARQHEMTSELASIRPIEADPAKLHRVVVNLVSNAIRYTPPGGSIQVIVDDAPADVYAGDWARLRVKDNGIGIPASFRHRIFEPFTDVKAAKHHTSSVPDSAGLGLFIARGLVELHGGLITVDSEEGQGSEFTVLMPRQR
ncbi:MAG TPA: HAMP domain-containing sensor histidine kinase [Kofleriaceae bacterium]|nr:HAMP domain-containing sensor histidine kinase [Kofleriaceae bacterium]